MKRDKQKKLNKSTPPTAKKPEEENKYFLFPWALLVIVITGICFSPMLTNGFTNWDDELYVIGNKLLHGPDWKGIFSQPVVSNYHPLTIASLAFNYSVSKLNPHSYLLLNFLLHLCNTLLVFYFIWNISGKKIPVAALTALIFGIHPMHVESVAWVSERKDVLYTFFFVLSLILYRAYLQGEKKIHYALCLLFFVLSLLSKPAAIILPFVLFLLDYWKGRPWNKKVFIEKIPFLLASVVFAIITFQIQSHKAVASLEIHPLWTRLFFACHVLMIYFIRFIVPYPLSAFHPYPPQNDLGLPVLLSPLFLIALSVMLWYLRKNKLVVFGILFFVVNLLLVLQIVAIGNTLAAERYTYVPYIGLSFLLGMRLNERKNKNSVIWIMLAVVTLVFGSITFERTKVWKDSGTLWNDVIRHYPMAPVPRSNRANYNGKIAERLSSGTMRDSLLQLSLEDCNVALKANPQHAKGYENRGVILLNLNRDKEALTDADSLIKLEPDNKLAYSIRGTAYERLHQPQKAIDDLTRSIELFSGDDFVFNKRAIIYFNQMQEYRKAIEDFNTAISINPKGQYYLYRAYCYVNLGDKEKARESMLAAIQMGEHVPTDLQNSLSR